MTEETLFHDALSRPADERAAHLEAACAGRPELLAAVAALLAAHEASRNPLDQTADTGPATVGFEARPGEQRRDEVIAGRYTLVEKLGEGGMGEVWVAQQTEPVKRRVALKLIKSGMDSSSVLARFEAERQALALMDHPNIARVLDGGVTPQRQPFFVMELVEGQPLTAFCETAKLNLRQRLELFVTICQAVQHAHQKGIVHRDLKPANILVTVIDGKPVPKVIDFGVAKATGGGLTDTEVQTQAGVVIGTLDYMAPEQAGTTGEDIDTRADVYSLGVILYELLTGTRPLDSQRQKQANLVEIVRAIREEEPARPSTRVAPAQARAMAGELDWIALRCLEKDRARRYESASDLARDVQRYLADEPVEARPPSFDYRLRKYIQRNWLTVAALATVAASLVVGLGVAVWQAVVATHAQAEEQKAKDNALALTEKERDAKNQAIAAGNRAAEATREKDAQLQRTQAVLFTSQMDRVGAVLERDPHAALTLLHDTDSCPISLRDLAWGFAHNAALRRQMPPASLPAFTHLPVVKACVFSPDGKWVAGTNSVGSGEKVTHPVTVVEFPSGRVRVELPPQRETVTVLSFSPDGNRLALVTDGETFRPLLPGEERKVVPGTVQIYDLATAKKLATLTGHTQAVRVVAWSPDGRLLASGGSDGTARVWDAATGQEKFKLVDHGKAVTALRFHPDGKRLASGGADHTVRLWNVATGKPLANWTMPDNPDPDLRGTRESQPQPGGPVEESIACLDFSPDGTTLVSASSNWLIEVRDVATGLVRAVVREGKGPAAWLQFDRVGASFLAFPLREGRDQCAVHRWDAQTGQRLATLVVGDVFQAALFNPAANLLVGFRSGTPWNIFDLDAPLDRARLVGEKVNGNTASVVFSPDGTRVIAAGGARIFVWDTRTGQLLHTLRGDPHRFGPLALSPDGRTLAAVSNGIHLWDSVTGESLGTLPLQARAEAVAFSPDGSVLAVLTRPAGIVQRTNPILAVFDAKSRQHQFDLKPTDSGFSFTSGGHVGLAFNPADGSLACVSGRALSIWDLTTRQLRRKMLVSTSSEAGSTEFLGLAFSPDGKAIVTTVLSARGGGELNVWNPETGELVQRRRYVGDQHLTFSPDGRNLVVAARKDLEIWDFATLQRRIAFPAHEKHGALNVAVSPDGRTLASVSIPAGRVVRNDNEAPLEVRLWDVGRPATTVALSNNMQVAYRFSPDRRTLVERDGIHGQMRFWELATGSLLRTVDITQHRIGLTFSADGRYLLGVDTPRLGGNPVPRPLPGPDNEKLREMNAQVNLLDTTTYAVRHFEVGKGPVRGVTFSPDTRYLALIHNLSRGFGAPQESSLEIWNLEENRTERTIPFADLAQAGIPGFSPDGRLVAVAGIATKEVHTFVLDRAEGTILARLREPSDGRSRRMEFTPDGRRLVLTRDSATGLSRLWDWRANTQQEERLPEGATGQVSPDGRYGVLDLPTNREVIDRTVRPLEIVTHRRKPAN